MPKGVFSHGDTHPTHPLKNLLMPLTAMDEQRWEWAPTVIPDQRWEWAPRVICDQGLGSISTLGGCSSDKKCPFLVKTHLCRRSTEQAMVVVVVMLKAPQLQAWG